MRSRIVFGFGLHSQLDTLTDSERLREDKAVVTRRELLTGTSVSLASVWTARVFTGNDLDFFSALDAASAIKSKKVSSAELTQRAFERIDKYNPKLNAFVYELRDRALAEAHKADDAVARKKRLGAFHGVPFCVKECFAVEGEPDTWGIPALKNSKAPTNSAAVDRLLDAGGILTGGTNVPYELKEWQSYNDIYVGYYSHARRIIGRKRGGAGRGPNVFQRRKRHWRIAAGSRELLWDLLS
jgi:Amidase